MILFKSIGVGVIFLLLWILSTLFVNLDLNFKEWDQSSRGMWLIVAVYISFASSFIFYTVFKNESK